jgi:hypothetical protein
MDPYSPDRFALIRAAVARTIAALEQQKEDANEG